MLYHLSHSDSFSAILFHDCQYSSLSLFRTVSPLSPWPFSFMSQMEEASDLPSYSHYSSFIFNFYSHANLLLALTGEGRKWREKEPSFQSLPQTHFQLLLIIAASKDGCSLSIVSHLKKKQTIRGLKITCFCGWDGISLPCTPNSK